MLEVCRSFSDHPAGFGLLYERSLEASRTLPEGLPFIEIGTREGGSALLILKAIADSGVDRPLITVDPYGKEYQSGLGEHFREIGEERYRKANVLLTNFCAENSLIHIPYRMTSEDWMEAWETTSLWLNNISINRLPFGLVYLDGEHTPETVSKELGWLDPRMHIDGLIIIDDTQHIRDSEESVIQHVFIRGEEVGNRLYYWPGGKYENNGRNTIQCDGKKIGTVYLFHHKETISI